MKKLFLLLLFPILLFSQNVKVRTIWLDTSRANIDTSHIFSPERFHRTVVFDSLFTIGGANVLVATDTNYFRNFSDIKYFKKTDLDTNRIVTTDKAQSIAGIKTFEDTIKTSDIIVGNSSSNGTISIYKFSSVAYSSIDSITSAVQFDYQIITGYRIGQSFTGDGKTLNAGSFNIKRTGSPTGTIRFLLYEHSGTYGVDGIPSGNPIDSTATMSISDLSTSYNYTSLEFLNGKTLTNGTNYFLIADPVYSYYTVGDRVYLSGRLNSTPAYGNYASGYFSVSSYTWSANQNIDLNFKAITYTSVPVYKYYTIQGYIPTDNRNLFLPDSSGTLALKEYTLKPSDTTTFRTASNTYYAPKIGSTNITTLGTITTGVWHGTAIDTAYTNAISKITGYNSGITVTKYAKDYGIKVDTSFLLTRYDTAGVFFRVADTATMLNKRFAKDTISLSNRINAKLNYSDTTSFRTFSDLKYLKNADSTTIRNYSNALYQSKGTYLIPSDTTYMVSRSKLNSNTRFDTVTIGIPTAEVGVIKMSNGTETGYSYLKNKSQAGLTWALPDSSGTLALKEYTLKPSDTVGVAFYNRDNVFDHTNYFTARDIHTSIAVDTIVAKSSGNKLYLQDTVNISGNLKIGSNFNGGIGNYDAGNNASSRSTFIHGTYDSIYSTTTTNGGENYIFGRNNTIGRTNPTGTYGNWLFGQYLRSEGLGLWALGADDDFQKKIIPFEGTIAFVNEPVRHWLSNTMPIYASGSYTWQSPHVKDSMAFSLTYQKAGSSVDSLAYAQFLLEGQREFIIDSKGMITYPDKAIRYLQINGSNDNAIRFNARNVSGKAFGNMYLDSGNFYISKGFAGFDSLRGSAGTTTYWNKTGYHSGLGASYFGNSTFGSGTFNGNVYPDATSSSRNLGTLGQGWTRVVIEHASSRAEGLLLRQTAAATAPPRIMFDNSASWAGQGVALYHNSPWTMSFTTGVTAGTSTGTERWRYDTLGIRPSTNAVFNSGSSGLNWLGVYSNNYYNGSTRWMDASRNLTNIGTISSGAITSTGLSTFGTNSGNATIGAGDSVQVTVTGLTSATGVATVCYKRGITSSATADTIATYDITANDKLTLFGKYGWTVSYTIMKK